MTVVSVIIPAHNAGRTVGTTLEALRGQDFGGEFEVIVVDDGSNDETARVVAAAALPVRLLRQRQAGPGAARNLGARNARGSILAFTDADCVPARDWLRFGVEALRHADLVQGAVNPDPAAARVPFDRSVWVTSEVGLYECANLFVRRDLFERIGGFEDWLQARLGKELAEDTWFGWRARRLGARTAFEPRALVHHAVFRRGPLAYVTERARLLYFPAIVAKVPELRRRLLFCRLFLNRRSAAFDLALVALVASLALGLRPMLLLAVPYLWALVRGALRWRLRAPLVAIVDLCADAVGLGALLLGSVRARSPVL